METTNNKMNENQIQFFDEIKRKLNCPFYFFGSIQRNDYFPNYSDIDVCLFSDNVNSLIIGLCTCLSISKNDCKKFLYKIKNKNRIVYGHKIYYKNQDKSIMVEFTIYDEIYKKDVLFENRRKTNLSYLSLFFLILLKHFYYYYSLIPKKIFHYFKKCILNGWENFYYYPSYLNHKEYFIMLP
jgi:hypothetical protein